MKEPENRTAYTELLIVESDQLMELDKSSIKITGVQNSINLLVGNGCNGRF